jgi:hypothetical protein
MIEAHPYYKRTGPAVAGERHDFVMHANDDLQREIRMAFLPFALRPAPGGRRRRTFLAEHRGGGLR